nr:hypothetical protein K-LCC10_0004 [Kaumoebavirus]
MDPALREFLGRELCEDVAGIIEEYVVGQARRVARAFRAVVREMKWKSYHDGVQNNNCKVTYFESGLERYQHCCENCGEYEEMRIYKGDKYVTSVWIGNCTPDKCSGEVFPKNYKIKIWWSPEGVKVIDRNGKHNY